MVKNFTRTILSALFSLPITLLGQNVGVDVATPEQKLDIAGGIRIGTTSNGLAGSLRWDSGQLQVHDGTTWVSLGANSDSQQLDVVQLSGTDLELSLQNDGIPTHVIDLSSLADNTDDQTIDLIQLLGNDLQISLEDDGVAPYVVDMSALANTDDQTADVFSITADVLSLSLEDDGVAPLTVDLTPYKDNTDNQQLDLLQLTGTTLEISLEDDGEAPQTLDLSLFDDNTDDQTIDLIQLLGNDLQISLEDDGVAPYVVDMSALANTDDQTADVFNITADQLTLSLEDDGVAPLTVDLTPYKDNTDNQQLDLLQLTGTTLEISLEDDGEAPQTLDLSVFDDNTDNQQIDDFSITTNILSLNIEDAGAVATVDLNPYLDNTDDQTIDVFTLTGTDLNLSLEGDATPTQIVDLSPLKTSLADDDDDTKVEVEANPDEDRIRFTTAAGERMIIREDGNVGIGTTVPDNLLTIAGSPSASVPSLGINSGNDQSTFNDGAQIAFGYNNTDEYQHFIHTRHNQLAAANNSIDFYVNDGTGANNTVTSGSTHVMSLSAGNVGVGTTDPQQLLQVEGTGRFIDLAGGGTRNVVVNNDGDLVPGSTNVGDITGVTAGTGLTGGGTTGNVTLDVVALNGLTTNANDIRLGGNLIQNTTITQGANSMNFNLSSTGDFNILDDGTIITHFRDDGVLFHGDDMYWRDGSYTGTNLMALIDDGNDGRLLVYENGATSVDLDANTQFIFNEQGLDRDFRVEGDNDVNNLRVNAGTSRVGIGDGSPATKLEIGDANGQTLMLSRQDGSITANEQLGGIGFDGSDGNTPDDIREASASIIAFASEDQGTGDKGGRLTFWTSPTNQDDDTDGLERLRIDQDGSHYVGGDMWWRDQSIGGANIARIVDDGDDGQMILYENGSTQILLDANGTSVFNEQGFNRDFRVESDGNANMFRVDASVNRIGVGTGAPSATLDVDGTLRVRNVPTSGSNTNILTIDGSGNVQSRAVGSWTGDNLGNHTATTTLNMNSQNITNVNIVYTRPNNSYDKLRVWNSSNYTIGMNNAMTLGGLNDYAMTFTMNNDADRGFVWRDVSDAKSDGAMALTTGGHLTVKGRIDVGTSATSGADLYLADRMLDWDNTGYYVDPNGASRQNEINFDNGSATDPSVMWQDDTNTGLYQPADNQMGVTVNGTRSTVWESDGDIRVYDNSLWDVQDLTVNTIYDEEDAQVDVNDELAVKVWAELDYDDNNSQGSSIDIGANGVFLEQTNSESSGFAANGDRSAIWSPGDGSGQGGATSSLLSIYDEDGMDLDFWFRDGGTGYADASWTTFSDRSIKTNIKKIKSGLDKVMQMRGVTYDLKKDFVARGDEEDGKVFDMTPYENMNGFIAQELMESVPEVVHFVEDRGLYAVNYDGVIPVLVEAIKEQQEIIDAMQKRLDRLEK